MNNISNDGRSNRTPMFIGEIHVTHTQRGADAKKVRPGKDAAFRHWSEVVIFTSTVVIRRPHRSGAGWHRPQLRRP
jgi:hypothetical protein